MSKPQDLKKISLLEQYVQTLQRQNYAKNGQTTLLYQQLQSLKQQNQMLKSFIQSTKTRWEEQRNQLTQQLYQKQIEQAQNVRNFGDQLRNSVDIGSLKAVAEDMRIQLQARQAQITQITDEKSELERQVHGLREQLGQATTKVTKSQQKLRNQMQLVKQLQNQIFGLKNSRVQNRSGVSFAKLQTDKLIRQNNQLIERIRILQKQKNGYYNQLKMTSPLKSRPAGQQNRSAQKSRCLQGSSAHQQNQGKSERWNLMQQKLRAIRSENEQLRANLAIN